jgi:EAL domain-containing protein (putative c-di-GMP-specific phosphodiesterase class I)
MARPRMILRPPGLQAAAIPAAAENSRALVYAINLFVERRGEAVSIAALTEGLGELYDETVGRIERLKRVISERSFTLAFQPIVRMADQTPHHFEALVRLGPDLPPGEAIGFAERIGLIEAFDLAIFDQVTEVLYRHRDISVAVNLSGRSLESTAFAASLEGALNRHTTLAGRLLFEVTETAEIRRLEQVNSVVQRLRAAGFHVCLDDFGSGANSFHYLRALSVDMVKIDGVYIRNALKEPTDRAFLRAMVGLCRDLGVATVAEMIETEEQAALIRELGVTFGQGYLFGRPSPEADAFDV